MGTSVGVPQFVTKIRRAGDAIDKARREQLKTIGKSMEETHAGVVTSALGAVKFRNWNVPLVAKATVISASDLRFAPKGRSAGPERVGEQGRHAGMAGPMQGPLATPKGKAKKNQKRKRWNGTTKGKQTWTKTTELLVKSIPPKLQSSFHHALEEIFH